ncbi:PRC-barrel domain-containing protein [Priestia abyssalis]|uniref:PRC-barrel domain-containing protein n=1 Tax=Priestia abyssalis TaxID=1221450 RepID=UPI002E25BFC4
MKKSIEVIKLPIISIAAGDQLGQVNSLVINPEKFSVDFLTIQQEDWQVSVKAIPFKKVIGVGEYAVTVENESAVIDLNEIPIANQLLNKKVGIIGSKVMTRKGELLGEILEYYLNDDNGELMGLSIKSGQKDVILPIGSVITLGKEMVIVNEHAKEAFLTEAEQLMEAAGQTKEEASSPAKATSEPAANKESEEPQSVKEKEAERQKEQIEVLKSKQAELLMGKKVTKNIYNK